MKRQTLHRISGRVILGLSLFAFLLVGGATVLTLLGRFNPAPDGDEGAAAHLFQLAIVLLLPAGLAHLMSADWTRPLPVAKRLVVPAVLVALAFATLLYMERGR